MEPDYYHFLFRTKLYLQLFKSRSRGIMDMRLRLYFDQLGQIPLIIPPLEQQAAIVRFLDYENARIENVIRAKKKLIILLNEQKQAIIHHAVTRGLNPAVKLKPSGIPWLGDMPKHWEMRPLKHWVKMNELTLGDSTNPNLEIHYIDIGSVKTGKLLHEPEKLLFKDAPSRAKRVLRKGDTIISTVRTYLKAIWYVDQEADSLIASTGFAVLSPRNVVEPEYLHYALQDNNFVDRVTANSIGIAYPAISETVIARFPVALPPSRQEQMELIHFIKNTTAPLSAAISTSEREISLLREYRTRLVADVVTGKLDVRKVAKDLPEESHRSDVSDFSDLVDNRTDLSNGDFEAIAEEES
jgi:type I restriction enzyme S subunit